MYPHPCTPGSRRGYNSQFILVRSPGVILRPGYSCTPDPLSFQGGGFFVLGTGQLRQFFGKDVSKLGFFCRANFPARGIGFWYSKILPS